VGWWWWWYWYCLVRRGLSFIAVVVLWLQSTDLLRWLYWTNGRYVLVENRVHDVHSLWLSVFSVIIIIMTYIGVVNICVWCICVNQTSVEYSSNNICSRRINRIVWRRVSMWSMEGRDIGPLSFFYWVVCVSYPYRHQ
jgi:hypothetical protein